MYDRLVNIIQQKNVIRPAAKKFAETAEQIVEVFIKIKLESSAMSCH
jgi:hypothetical protein